jgi:hypothetical protein
MASPAQRFPGQSPATPMTISRFPPPRRARAPWFYHSQTEWPSYTPRKGFPCRRLLRLAGPRRGHSKLPPREATALTVRVTPKKMEEEQTATARQQL